MAGWNPADESSLTVAAHQAAGIIAEQVHCDIHEAYRRLFAVSSATGQSVDNTALDVIGQRIRFQK